jgi:hypothetical protein
VNERLVDGIRKESLRLLELLRSDEAWFRENEWLTRDLETTAWLRLAVFSVFG